MDYLRVVENTRCLLAGLQRPRLRRCMCLMMEAFKFSRKRELREAVLSVSIPGDIEDALNEYIMDTAPDDFVQRPLPFAPCVLCEEDLLSLIFQKKVC